jgi:hypothetical protein
MARDISKKAKVIFFMVKVRPEGTINIDTRCLPRVGGLL